MRNPRRESGRLLIVVAVLVALSAGVIYWKRVVQAPQAAFEEGLEAYRQRSFGKAALEWREAASLGHPEAAFRLAELHLEGRGVERNHRRAVELLEQAATGGYAKGQLALARLLEQGRGAPPDMEEALSWYATAAANDLPEAQLELGRLYDEGRGVEEDPYEAAAWFRRAAEGGMGEAQLRLALLYETGRGVDPDTTQAVHWLRLAAEDSQLPEAWYRMGLHYEEGTGSFERNLEQAVWCYENAARDLHGPSLYRLGQLSLEGRGVKQDNFAAATYFGKAAGQGHVDAMYQVGHLFQTGVGVPRSRSKAETWLKKAADAGSVDAMAALQELGLRQLSRSDRRRLAQERERERAEREREQARRMLDAGRCELYGNGGTVVEMRTRMDCLNRGGSFRSSAGDAGGSFSTVDPERDWDTRRRELNRRASAERRRSRSQGYDSGESVELETDWVACYSRTSRDSRGHGGFSCSSPMRKRRDTTTSWCRDRGYEGRRLFKHESSARSWVADNCR